MVDYVIPRVLVSKCIEFDSCRFNGGTIASSVVKSLKDFVEFHPVCPEAQIGLGVPRKVLRLVKRDGENKLIQTETEKDFTEQMAGFAFNYFSDLGEIDGAILKSRSPSCGTNDVKVYSSVDQSGVVERSAGVFGAAVQKMFSFKPIENEGRLRNFRLRENFYTSLFALARFRNQVVTARTLRALSDYQARHKFLLMAYDQEKMRELGQIAANREDIELEQVISSYRGILQQVFSQNPSYGSHVNVLQHAFGYFSNHLKAQEKSLFTEYIQDYRQGKVPLSTIISLVRSWIVRFDQEYLKNQRYFDPYPRELVEISDSGKGRDF